MKKLFILLFSTISLTIFSQSSIYKPFCNNPSWTVVTTNFGITSYDTYQYQLDTAIGVNIYKKIKEMNSPNKYVFFRENISQKKIYQYDIANSLEYLYVDFSLNLGYPFTVIVNGGTYTTTVIIKDSMLINGCYHNRMCFSQGSGYGYVFVEGILSPKDPLNPFYWGGDPYVQLVCECHNGQTYYFENGGSWNNFSCFLTCTPASPCSVVNSVNELNNSIEKPIIFPNPSHNFVFIKSKIDMNGKKYTVLDYTGREFLADKYDSVKGVDIKDLPSGIYTINLDNVFLKLIKIH